MKKVLLLVTLLFVQMSILFAQGGYISSNKNSCNVHTSTPNGRNADWSGECRNGYAQGQGILKMYENGQLLYTASCYLIDGKANGQATYTWLDGKKYVGGVVDTKWSGQGTYTYTNGNKYVGEWKDGKYNGQGTYTWTDGKKYVGEFRDGKFNGQGTYTWADGQKYVGEWKDDKRNGQGTQTYVNGEKYVGEWKDDNKYDKLAEMQAEIDRLKKANENLSKKTFAIGSYVYTDKATVKNSSGEWVYARIEGRVLDGYGQCIRITSIRIIYQSGNLGPAKLGGTDFKLNGEISTYYEGDAYKSCFDDLNDWNAE